MRRYINKIDFVFYNEGEIKAGVEEARESRPHFEVRNNARVSDPTATQALRTLTPISTIQLHGRELREPEAWLEVIRKVYEWSATKGTHYDEVLRARYRGYHFRGICAKYHISVGTFYRLVNDARYHALLWAVQGGLIHLE